MDNLEILDLFCGAGGFSLGAHFAGFRVKAAVDNDPDLTSSFRVNFPNTKVRLQDLANTSPSKLMASLDLHRGEVAGIIGGPPCQGVSLIGKRNLTDPRNDLIYRFFEFVREIRPGFFLFENVPGLLTDRFAGLLDASLELVADGGAYHLVGPKIIDANHLGAATIRPRVFILGYAPDVMGPVSLEELRNDRGSTVRDAIDDLPSPSSAYQSSDGYYWGEYLLPAKSGVAKEARRNASNGLGDSEIMKRVEAGEVSGVQPTNHTNRVIRRFSQIEQGMRDPVSRASRLSWSSPAPALRAGTGKDRGSYQALRPIHPTEDRVITVREAARIQGFPDWFRFHRTKWHSFRMIGNSVSPMVARAILARILESCS